MTFELALLWIPVAFALAAGGALLLVWLQDRAERRKAR